MMPKLKTKVLIMLNEYDEYNNGDNMNCDG